MSKKLDRLRDLLGKSRDNDAGNEGEVRWENDDPAVTDNTDKSDGVAADTSTRSDDETESAEPDATADDGAESGAPSDDGAESDAPADDGAERFRRGR